MAWKIGYFDIEATELTANRGHLLCAALKIDGVEAPTVWRITDYKLFKKEPWSDADLCHAIAAGVEGLDLVVTWFGGGYDLPFVNSRLLKHGQRPIERRLHQDAWRLARANLKLTSNRLESVSDFFGTKDKKNHLNWDVWEQAAFGVKEAMDYIADHCALDVTVLEEVFTRLKVFIRQVRT